MEPVARGRLSEIASDFIKEVQRALKETTVEIPVKRRNHLGLTREEKEIVSRDGSQIFRGKGDNVEDPQTS